MICHSATIHLFPLIVLANRAGIFRRINMTSLTTSRAVTITIWLRNTPSIKISCSHQMFTSYFLQWTQHLVPDTLITLTESRLIELTPSNEWTWIYRLPNRARLDPNERCTPPLPTSSDNQRQWDYNCFDEYSKVDNSVVDDCDTYYLKTTHFFMCSHFKVLIWSLSKV